MSPQLAMLRSIFERLTSDMGQATAQSLWRDAARRPRGRPSGSSDPEHEKALLVETVLVLSCEQFMQYLSVGSQLRKSFALVAFTLGQKAAQQLWRDAARRSRGKPLGSSSPEKDKELLRITDAAINGPNPMPLQWTANLIHEGFPLEFGASPEAIAKKLGRLIASLKKS